MIIAVGPSDHNRNSLISRHFPSYEVISLKTVASDLIGDCGDETVFGEFSRTLYSEVYRRAALKLDLGERVIINESNLVRGDRAALSRLGAEYGVPVFYLTSDPTDASEHAMREFRASEREIMHGDGGAEIIDWRLHTPDPVSKEKPSLDHLRSRWRGITVIADIHGMMQSLLSAISWARARNHYIIFLGDIIDYGPDSLDVVNEVYRIVMRGHGELILGNHERKIAGWITNSGKPPRLSEGNRATTNAIEALGEKMRIQWSNRFMGLMAHTSYWREIGNVVLAHGGIIPTFWSGEVSRTDVEKFCIFGEVTGFNPDHKPNRAYSWTNSVPSDTTVIVGHDIRSTQYPVQVKNKMGGSAIFLDNGCGKGGHLSTVDLKFSGDGMQVMNFNVH